MYFGFDHLPTLTHTFYLDPDPRIDGPGSGPGWKEGRRSGKVDESESKGRRSLPVGQTLPPTQTLLVVDHYTFGPLLRWHVVFSPTGND